jgi:hypothetical protein
VVENAGFGATWAGPIASLIVEKYLNDTLRPHRLKEVDRIASKEIILPVIRQKRQRLDSIRKARTEGLERSVSSSRSGAGGGHSSASTDQKYVRVVSATGPKAILIHTGSKQGVPGEKRDPSKRYPNHQSATMRKDEGTKS